MQLLSQQARLFFGSVRDNILMGNPLATDPAPHQPLVPSAAPALVRKQKMGLNTSINEGGTGLSGGKRQALLLARARIPSPKILLLDEPFSALDYQTKLNLEDLVFNTLKTYQKTAVLVTHDIGEAIAMSDRILLFSKQPGTIHKTFTVPESLKGMTPFDARQEPEFQVLFQTIWKELNHLEQHQTKS